MAIVNAVGVGPWGGLGGRNWDVNGDIRKIVISYGDAVDSLIITYIEHGVTKTSSRFGGPGGAKTAVIELGAGEFLVSIEGVVNNSQSVTAVASLTFVTNLRLLGPFGKGTAGTDFSLPVKNGKSAGLFGRAGSFLDAIGIGLVPVGQAAVELGPWGGTGGTAWVYNEENIRSFRVASDGEVIVSITFNGSNKFGGIGGNFYEPVTLQPDEHLRYIKGATGKHENVASVLQIISFVTNKQTYGPYGKAGAGAVPFDPPVQNGKIVGFFGRRGAWIDAIGFKVVPVLE